MKVTEDAANRVLRSKVLCVINLVGLFPPDGLQELLKVGLRECCVV